MTIGTGSHASLLNTSRRRTSAFSGRTIVTESESDRGRVLFCPAFRRLQQKAQVFSMEPNAAVRSRLTHSLEVSQVGRYIADEVGRRLVEKNLLGPEHQIALVNFVETACLMHDIGNPPFGHFGEAAIKKWFGTNGEECVRLAIGQPENGSPENLAAMDEIKNSLADFVEFDGNPQGLRVVARLQWNTDEFGLNLTKTTLATFLKYIRGAGSKEEGLFTKKAGYFSTEKEVVEDVWREFQYSTAQRFPLTYMMEAADDIAYCISDLEDSFEKEIVHKNSALLEIEEKFSKCNIFVSDVLHGEIKSALQAVRDGCRNGKEFTFTDFRTTLNRAIVANVATRYVDRIDDVMKGKLETLLPKEEPAGAILESLKSYCQEHVYPHVSVQRIELAGYTAIKGLLDHFRPLLEVNRDSFSDALDGKAKDSCGNSIVIESKLLSLFPKNYKKVYKYHLSKPDGGSANRFEEWNARAHLIVDFVSGMTDDFAMTFYRTLAGMRL